jgi:hypothetical protein
MQTIPSTGSAPRQPSCWTFVEVSLGGVDKRTEAVCSVPFESPMWHQELLFPLSEVLPGGQPCTGMPAEDLKIRVFSEVIRINNDNSGLEKPTTRTVIRRLLAYTSIPLTSICQQQPLQAVVQLTVPPALLNHRVALLAPRLTFFGAVQGAAAQTTRPPAPATTSRFRASTESASLVAHIQSWEAKVAALTTTQPRCMDAMVCNLQGMGTCVTRFVAAVPVLLVVQKQVQRLQQRLPAMVCTSLCKLDIMCKQGLLGAHECYLHSLLAPAALL